MDDVNARPLRLCFFADAAAEHTRRWAKFFALRGDDVHVITWRPRVLEDYDPVKVHVFKKPIDVKGTTLARVRNLFPVLRGISRLLKDLDPDLIHAHSVGAYAWMAMLSRRHPYVATPWGSDILLHIHESRVERLFTTAALKRADLVTCDAYFVKDEAIALGVRPERVEVITFGVDLERFTARPPRPELRADLGWQEAVIVVSNRTLTPIHDVDTLVHAIPKVLSRAPTARFVLLGGGSERDRLEKLADELGVRDKTYFGGHVTEDEMAEWLRTSDVYVSTSLSDAGLAAGTAEAMASELPVVSTDNSENDKWIDVEQGGFLVPNGDASAVADAILRLVEDAELRRRYGDHNRGVIEERNNYEREMSKMGDLYRRLVEKSDR